MFPSFVLASFVLLALQTAPLAAPSPAPSVVGSPTAEQVLPEIGRVRAIVPACAVMHDITGPAFLAAREADNRFKDAANRLPQYARAVDDEDTRFGIEREMLITRIDMDLSNMTGDLHKIDKLLDDPRLSNVRDPQVTAQRNELTNIYNMQYDRVTRLFEFVQRERLLVSKKSLEPESGNPFNNVSPTPIPIPSASEAPYGQPTFRGITEADQRTLRDWAGRMDVPVRVAENNAARTFLSIAASCR